MKTFNHNKFAGAAVTMLGVMFFATGAHADEANSLMVHYSDLNPNSAAGAKVLYQRIQMAAKQVCGEMDERQLERAAAAKACFNQAVENSVRAVNTAQLNHVASEHGIAAHTGVTVASAR